MKLYRMESATMQGSFKLSADMSEDPKCNAGIYTELGCLNEEYNLDSSGYCSEWHHTHPTLFDDMKLNNYFRSRDLSYACFMFGFASLQQLKQWFSRIDEAAQDSPELTKLIRIGVYEVPDQYFVKGTFQCVAHGLHMELEEIIEVDDPRIKSIEI